MVEAGGLQLADERRHVLVHALGARRQHQHLLQPGAELAQLVVVLDDETARGLRQLPLPPRVQGCQDDETGHGKHPPKPESVSYGLPPYVCMSRAAL